MTKDKRFTVPIYALISSEQYAALKADAVAHGVSMASLLRGMIDDSLLPSNISFGYSFEVSRATDDALDDALPPLMMGPLRPGESAYTLRAGGAIDALNTEEVDDAA